MQKGFTLLEVMVALVIFSVISVGAFHVLSGMLRSQAELEDQGGRLEALQRLLLMTRHDMSQIAPRAPVSPDIQIGADGSLAFTRLGWRNPLGENRSALAYMRYSVTGGVFTRQLWPFAQSADDYPALAQSLADGVRSAHFTAVIIEKPVPAANPAAPVPPAPQRLLPDAIEYTVSLPPFGEVRQLVPLVQTP